MTYFVRSTGCPDWLKFSAVILRCHSDVDLTTSAILTASSNCSLIMLWSKNASTSSSASPSLPPSAVVASLVAWRRAWAIVVACNPCPASNGVHPIAELNVVFKANWKAGSAIFLNCLYSWSVSFLIMEPMDWFTLSQIEFPLGLCPPVRTWLILRYSQIADTAPLNDDNSGALSVLNVRGTPLSNMTWVNNVCATLSCVLLFRCVSIVSLVNRSTMTIISPSCTP